LRRHIPYLSCNSFEAFTSATSTLYAFNWNELISNFAFVVLPQSTINASLTPLSTGRVWIVSISLTRKGWALTFDETKRAKVARIEISMLSLKCVIYRKSDACVVVVQCWKF